MLKIDKDTKTIHINRGDIGTIKVYAIDDNDKEYKFQPKDIIRLTIVEKNNYSNDKLTKDYEIDTESEYAELALFGEDTRFDEPENKPIVYWYTIELNPDTLQQTLIGHDEKGPKQFIIYPEGVKL